jgi:para-aminobenzoate synthetase component 1
MTNSAVNSFLITDVAACKQKMLSWANQFNIFCFLDNQDYSIAPHQYECLLAVGTTDVFDVSKPFDDITSFLQSGNWYFGHLAYELGSQWHGVSGSKPSKIHFPLYFFFKPVCLLWIHQNKLFIQAMDAEEIYQAISKQSIPISNYANAINLRPRYTQAEYINVVQKLQQHIQHGDCYEVNFCQEFYAEEVQLEPLSVFRKLVKTSPNPFCAFYKLNDQYLLCASPERFLNKTGSTLVSQPIKGTAKRNKNNSEQDDQLRQELYTSPKERSENVMVVDLVRNDLSRICIEGSVVVDELFGIYSFPQVHQMISTVRGTIRDSVSFPQIIHATFPMGSMTGAPKKRVIELIHQYEASRRGIFSGSVGYITPEGDFDFNVVIRSLMYNESEQYLSCQVGSGITIYSDPVKEWEECLLKAEAIKKVLTNAST